ncbi:hypothetical protein B0H13DRAFT_2354907 [Mycena leptocephala]|nr:hypothetical protein B0H13DRAFT_2354907 [Mycena leptocephala]
MPLSTIFFNTTFRVWNIRLIFVEAIGPIICCAPSSRLEDPNGPLATYLFLTLTVILLHHTLAVFQWPTASLGIVDVTLVIIELGVMCYIALSMSHVGLFFVPLLAGLIFSIIFRVATILKSSTRVLRQPLAFLGGCKQVKPPYTPLSILLNRSITQPLVRAESKIIILARALVLSGIVLGVPVFALYVIVLVPLRAQIYVRSIAHLQDIEVGDAPGKATFSLPFVLSSASVNHSALLTGVMGVQDGTGDCSATWMDGDCILACPYEWSKTTTIVITATFSPGIAFKVVPLAVDGIPKSPYITRENDWIPMLHGSHVFGYLTWTQRQILSRSWGISVPLTTSFTAEARGLQTYQPNATAAPDVSMLTLYQEQPDAIRLLQEASDASPLSGVSTFGGFWSFLNGAFALFFGANVFYFALRRRPLSALGLVHIFQQRTLVRQWHKDFPAIHTEGGSPGSESAGIVAFIRERLVDVGEDPGEITGDSQSDVEEKDPQWVPKFHEWWLTV